MVTFRATSTALPAGSVCGTLGHVTGDHGGVLPARASSRSSNRKPFPIIFTCASPIVSARAVSAHLTAACCRSRCRWLTHCMISTEVCSVTVLCKHACARMRTPCSADPINQAALSPEASAAFESDSWPKMLFDVRSQRHAIATRTFGRVSHLSKRSTRVQSSPERMTLVQAHGIRVASSAILTNGGSTLSMRALARTLDPT